MPGEAVSGLEDRVSAQATAGEMRDDLLAGDARMLVAFGANVQPDQILRAAHEWSR